VTIDDRDGSTAGDVEWIGFEPDRQPDVLVANGWRWRWWYALIGVGLLAAGLAVHASDRSPTAAASNRAAPSVGPTPAGPIPTISTPPASFASTRQVTQIGHPILDVPPGWELFGQSSGAVVSIRLGLGEITTTSVPQFSSGRPVSLLAGADRVLVRPYDTGTGYVIPDGQPAVATPGVFSGAGPLLPGPDAAHVWVLSLGNSLALVNLDGSPAGVTITVPSDAGIPVTDQSGYVIFYATSGVYDARPDGVKRITTGYLLAAGPHDWLVNDCDDQHRCSSAVVDRTTGARRPIAVSASSYVPDSGIITADGSTAAMVKSDASGKLSLHLLDLMTGRDRDVGVALDTSLGYQSGVETWSPDSRWLFAIGNGDRLLAIDARSGGVTDLGVSGTFSALALRAAG
jgi:hypothetical protein